MPVKAGRGMKGIRCAELDHNLPVAKCRNRDGNFADPAGKLLHGEACRHFAALHRLHYAYVHGAAEQDGNHQGEHEDRRSGESRIPGQQNSRSAEHRDAGRQNGRTDHVHRQKVEHSSQRMPDPVARKQRNEGEQNAKR
ncbi:hypothetical protein D3C71_1825890 [compost metagenome]